MTATPGSDSVHAQIAEVLRDSALAAELMQCNEGVADVDCPACSMPVQVAASIDGVPVDVYGSVEGFARLLAPLVDSLRAEAKAEALEAFAAELDAAEKRCAEWPLVAETYHFSAGYARYCANRARAAVYRTNPSSEETSCG